MDWQRYRLAIMAVLALAMVGITWWAVTDNTGETVADPGEDAAPALPEIDVDTLTELEIRRPDDEAPIRLVRDDAESDWRVASPVEAPASQTAVDTAIEKIGELEVVGRPVASTDRHHEQMEVDEAHGIRVIARAGSETVIDLYVGAFRAGNTLVRVDGSDAVLAVRGSIKFAFNKPVRDFRERAITQLTASEVSHLAFTNEAGSWSFEKRGDAWSQVLVQTEGGEVPIEGFDPAKVGAMVSGLARLRASDFAEAGASADSLGLGEGAARVVIGLTAAAGDDAEGGDDGDDGEAGGDGDDAAGDDAAGDDAAGDDAAGDDAAAGDEPTPLAPPTSTVVLLIGNEHEDGQRYVQVEGSETIYIVSRLMADRLLPDAEDFQESDEPETPAAAPGGMPPGMPGMPGMPGGGGPGGGQIPPELMEQIQRQLQQQGGGAPPGH